MGDRDDDADAAWGSGDPDALDRARLIHELQVHQIELEAQNQAMREALGQLEESRSRYVDLYDFAPIPYFTFDEDGIVREVNLTGAAMLGLERSRVVDKPFIAIARCDDASAFARHIAHALTATVPVRAELVFTGARGLVDAELVSAAVRTGSGSTTLCRTAMLDITLRRAAEREAIESQASERRLLNRLEGIDRASAAMSAALAAMRSADVTSFLQVVVDHARAIVGAHYAALGVGGGAGRRFDPWVHSGLRRQQAEAIGRAPRGVGLLGAVIHAGRPIRLARIHEHAAFTGFPAHHPVMTSFLGVPIRYQGQIHGHLYLADKQGAEEFSEDDQRVIEILADRVGVAMEVARLRQVEAREHTRLDLLARAGPLLAPALDRAAMLDAIARVIVPVAADVCAISLLDDNGTLRHVTAYHPEPEKQALLDARTPTTPPGRFGPRLRDAIASGRPQLLSVQSALLADVVPDPNHRHIVRALGVSTVIVAPLVLDDRVIGILSLAMAQSGRTLTPDDVVVAQEVAHHAALAYDRARLYDAARNAVAARDRLMEVVSHDLRNYLHSIRLSAELLSRPGPSDGRDRELRQVEAIKLSVKRIDELIASLRDATMIETGDFTIDATVVDLGPVLHESLRTLEPLAAADDRRLVLTVPRPLPLVWCDRARIMQVLANLVTNAIKFTEPSAEIDIVAQAQGEVVRIAVSDTGRGLSENERQHVFDRHWRARPGARGGSGLGLYIVKGIVQAHGGQVHVDSEPGVGSTFWFTLPVGGSIATRSAGTDSGAPPHR